MDIALWILGIIVAALAVVLLIAATKPGTFSLSRSTRIAAPAARVFPFVSDFHQWTHWSPWEKMDADLQRKYSGAEKGVGAVYEWQGAKTGQGRMEIAQAAEPSYVNIKLDFLKPFKASNIAEFKLDEQAGMTNVTWTMSGKQVFIGKVMSLFFNMDKVVGKSFEEGLADLKRVSEAA